MKNVTIINETKQVNKDKYESNQVNLNNNKQTSPNKKNKSSNVLIVENSTAKQKLKTRRPLDPKTKKIALLDSESLLKNSNNIDEKNCQEILLFEKYLDNDIKQNKKLVARNVGDYYIKNSRKNTISENDNSDNDNFNNLDIKRSQSQSEGIEKVDLNDINKKDHELQNEVKSKYEDYFMKKQFSPFSQYPLSQRNSYKLKKNSKNNLHKESHNNNQDEHSNNNENNYNNNEKNNKKEIIQDNNNNQNNNSKKSKFFAEKHNQNLQQQYNFKRASMQNYIDGLNQLEYNEFMKFINNTQVLCHITECQKSLLACSLKKECYQPNEYVTKKNDKAKSIYIIKEGQLKCIDKNNVVVRILGPGENFGERGILTDSRRTMDVITITECICFSISVKSLKKIVGKNYKSFLFLNLMKAAFRNSKNFNLIQDYIMEKIFNLCEPVNLGKDNVAYPKNYIKSSKIVILLSGDLVNAKNGEVICKPNQILFEDDLLTLSQEKTDYAIDPSPDALFLEGDTNKILQSLNCKNFQEIVDKIGIIENFHKIPLFKSLSNERLTSIINLIHIEKYNEGEKIIKEGSFGANFYIVKEGEVVISVNNVYLRTLNKKEYFGERSLLTNEKRSATVIAKTKVELYCLSKQCFLRCLSNAMKEYLFNILYLHDEKILLENLLFIKKLGSGTFGSVSLVINNQTKYPYAIKLIPKTLIDEEELHHYIELEKNILLKIDHPFIVKLVKSLKDSKNIFFIMEYVQGKELYEVINDIGYLNKTQNNFYICSMLLAINYLHQRKIIYRDIKPENIMVLPNGYIKLVDFGAAKEIIDRTKTIIGTPHYMAPEVLFGKGYSFEVDYWSIAICMYEFICGEVPFGEDAKDPMSIYIQIVDQKLTFPVFVEYDRVFKSIMKAMLDKNPSNRLTNFYEIQKHTWFKDFKWDDLLNLNMDAPYKPIINNSKVENILEMVRKNEDFDVSKYEKYIDVIKEEEYKPEKIKKISKKKMEKYNLWFKNF